MCGINARLSTRNFNIESMYNKTKNMAHRGDGDGLSISYNNNGIYTIVKSVLKHAEIEKGEVDQKTRELGNAKTEKDKKKIREAVRLRKLQLSNIENTLEKSSKIAILHNRKATYGSINLSNCHPIIRNDFALYHNGTSDCATNIKRFVEFDNNIKIDGTTDTAMIAYLFNSYLERFSDGKLTQEGLAKVYDALLSTISPFGVLMIKHGDRLIMMSDSSRSLYYYSKSDGIDHNKWFISEPVVEGKFDCVLKIIYGWAMFDIDTTKIVESDWVIERVDGLLNYFYDAYPRSAREMKCDVCDTRKADVRRVVQYKDICPDCFASDVPITDYTKKVIFTPSEAIKNPIPPPPTPENTNIIKADDINALGLVGGNGIRSLDDRRLKRWVEPERAGYTSEIELVKYRRKNAIRGNIDNRTATHKIHRSNVFSPMVLKPLRTDYVELFDLD